MAFGRVAIAGDAAFVARPHVAAGVSKAADDAATLAEALSAEQDVAAALERYQATRLGENVRSRQVARIHAVDTRGGKRRQQAGLTYVLRAPLHTWGVRTRAARHTDHP